MSSSKITPFFYSPSLVIFLSDKMLDVTLVFVKTVLKSINGCLHFPFLCSKANSHEYRQQTKWKSSSEFSAHHLLLIAEEAQVTLAASSRSLDQPQTKKSTWAASDYGGCAYAHTLKHCSTSQELNSTEKQCFRRASKPLKH